MEEMVAVDGVLMDQPVQVHVVVAEEHRVMLMAIQLHATEQRVPMETTARAETVDH